MRIIFAGSHIEQCMRYSNPYNFQNVQQKLYSNRDIRKVHENGGLDPMFGQKTIWCTWHGMNVVDKKKTWVKTQKCIDFGEIWVSPWVSYFCVSTVLWEEPFSLVAMWRRLKWMRREVTKQGKKLLCEERSWCDFLWEEYFSILCDKS
jgi:hypothetical protein